ncbi:MAG TPA: GNAT family N-acetyltransferase [Beijerinckiaceae bacterium]|nr:GNAT family N-acetyltransferase [Beijerinckiaceae bacterium]
MTYVATFDHQLDLPRVDAKARHQGHEVILHHGPQAVRALLAGFQPRAECSVFQHSAWISAWIDTLGTTRRCDSLAAEVRQRSDGMVVMVLPLIRRWSRGLRLIEQPDFGIADYGGALIAPGFAPDAAAMRAIWADLVAALPKADLLRIYKLPERTGTLANPLLLLKDVRRSHLSAFTSPLHGLPFDILRIGMTRKRLRDLNRRLGNLKAMGDLEFSTASNPQEAEKLFDIICAQRAARFAELGRPNCLAHADMRAFFRALLYPTDGKPLAVVQATRLNGTVIAASYALNSGNSLCMIFPTVAKGEWMSHSPGLQHFRFSMEWAAEQGLTAYDFTIGSEQYKAELGAVEHALYELYQPLTLRGRLASATLTTRWHIRERPALASRLRKVKQFLSFGRT